MYITSFHYAHKMNFDKNIYFYRFKKYIFFVKKKY